MKKEPSFNIYLSSIVSSMASTTYLLNGEALHLSVEYCQTRHVSGEHWSYNSLKEGNCKLKI